MEYSNVLFVDDQEIIMDMIKIKFKNEDYNKFYATDVDEAFDILKNNDINVIISDMMMPKLNGIKFLSMVEKMYPDTVRIILSGYTQVGSILSAINEGAIYRYITKPWKIDNEAKELIREAIEYSKFLREKRNSNLTNIDKNKLYEFIGAKCTSYAVYNSKNEIVEMKNIDIKTDIITENEIQNLKNDGFNHINLSLNFNLLEK
ncbi:response regulator [Peptostreptococcaceae bacterium AGR-M142]